MAKQRIAAWVISAAVSACFAPLGTAQTSGDLQGLTKEVETLKAGQAAMQKDLQEIKSLLQGVQAQQAQPAQAQAAPARSAGAETTDVTVSLAGAPSKGESNAKLTLVEFTDYQCPFCSRHFRQIWPQIEQNYVKTGKVKLVLRDMPLEAIHPQALKAAEATHCAADQGKFWEMHDRLFANQTALQRKDLSTHAQELGLDVAAFDQCVDSAKGTARVRKDVQDSSVAGARGTPTFYIGLTQPNSTDLKAVRIIRGAQPYASFKEAFDI